MLCSLHGMFAPLTRETFYSSQNNIFFFFTRKINQKNQMYHTIDFLSTFTFYSIFILLWSLTLNPFNAKAFQLILNRHIFILSVFSANSPFIGQTFSNQRLNMLCFSRSIEYFALKILPITAKLHVISTAFNVNKLCFFKTTYIFALVTFRHEFGFGTKVVERFQYSINFIERV